MSNLPFIQPKRDIYLNLGILLIIINRLAVTSNGKRNLSFERLQCFYFLVNNPLILNKVVSLAERKEINIKNSYFYKVESVSLDVDDLYDKNKLKLLIKIISLYGYLSVEINSDSGFVFYLSDKGSNLVSSLDSDYFNEINQLVEALLFLRSKSISKIVGFIRNAIR
ncbi:ABC-three component system middle component 4 [Acinetobacter baumannii]|uniref:ABC-three component system middle component 4 n=1 Tax=Acinetobacter baumannii TaxID=470 RepID=UPI0024489C32|nr:ABC-three component system middle component 4 [Acinetobacter baumannii]MDH2570541.1 hypothetical protein [Acinetobacter baumannii]